MKKLLSITLVMVLILSILTACGGGSSSGSASTRTENSGTRSGSDGTQNSASRDTTTADSSDGGETSDRGSSSDDFGLDDIDWDEYDKAMSEASEYLKSLGLEEDEYGFTQYGVWNADLLPDCVPPEPSGGVLSIDRTEFKDKNHEDLMGGITGTFNVGNIEFPDKYFVYHMVMFECTQAQLDEFTSGMITNGFDVFDGPYKDSNDRSIYEWLGNDYYAYMSASPSWDESEDRINCTFEITPLSDISRPKSFNGTPLPDFGLETYYYDTGGYGWNESGGDWEEVSDFWDIYADKGKLPEQWTIDYHYSMVKAEQVNAYVQSLVSKGWSIEYENESHDDYNDSDQYYVSFEKDGAVMRVQYSSGGTDGMSYVEVYFGSSYDVFG